MEQGPKGVTTGSMACSSATAPCSPDMEVSGRWSNGKPDRERASQLLIPSIPPTPKALAKVGFGGGFGGGLGGGGVWGVSVPVVSLEMIACPGARREGCTPAQRAGLSRRRNFFFNSLLWHFFTQWWHLWAQARIQSSCWIKRIVCCFSPPKVNHLSHYTDRSRISVKLNSQSQLRS